MKAYNSEIIDKDNTNRKVLSVIVPVYNSEKYLHKCLESILNQTEKDLEIICVDDGSNDDSGNILDEYAAIDHRVVVIHKENGGLVSARKAGLKKASGEYVAHVDADDWIETGMYSDVTQIIRAFAPDVICTGIIRDYGDITVKEPSTITEGLYVGDELKKEVLSKLVDINSFMKYNIGPHLVTKIARRELIRKHYYCVPNSTDICEDLVSSYPMLLDSHSVYICDECYYHYVSVTGSMVNKIQIDKYASLCSTYDYFRKAIIGYMENIPSLKVQYSQLRIFDMLCVAPEHIMKYENYELYPYGRVEAGSKVVIYGAGGFGKSIKKYLETNTDLQVVAWVDKQGDGREIKRPDQLIRIDFDIIVIGVLLFRVVETIIRDLQALGVELNRILYVKTQNLDDSYENQRDSGS